MHLSAHLGNRLDIFLGTVVFGEPKTKAFPKRISIVNRPSVKPYKNVCASLPLLETPVDE